MAEKTQVQDIAQEKETESSSQKPEGRPTEVPPERIERMKRAFRPTWLYDQINSAAKGPNKKE